MMMTNDDYYFWKQLDQSGVYKFKVKVTAVDQSYGYAFINVTVLPGELCLMSLLILINNVHI